MNSLDVRIVKLQAMRVASVWGFGERPEIMAWQKLEAWAGPKGLLDDPEAHPIFGFNNPSPSPDSPNYGYELWINVDASIKPEDGIRISEFRGGLYAVARCEVPQGQAYDIIPRTWERLAQWCEDSRYHTGGHQWLEKSVPSDRPEIEFTLDLYLPIVE